MHGHARLYVLVLFALFGLALASEKAVEIRNRHAFIPSTAKVRYGIRVQKHEDNRLLRFQAVDQDDGNVVRSTEEQLDGEAAPLYREIEWMLPTGDLLLIAQLYGINGRQARDSMPVCVYSVTAPCGEADEP